MPPIVFDLHNDIPAEIAEVAVNVAQIEEVTIEPQPELQVEPIKITETDHEKLLRVRKQITDVNILRAQTRAENQNKLSRQSINQSRQEISQLSAQIQEVATSEGRLTTQASVIISPLEQSLQKITSINQTRADAAEKLQNISNRLIDKLEAIRAIARQRMDN